MSTSEPKPCPRCQTTVPPRGRRIQEDFRPLCDTCLADTGLANTDAVLAAAAALEAALEGAIAGRTAIPVTAVLDLVGTIVETTRTLASDHLDSP